MIKNILLVLIRGYQRIFSPDHGVFNQGFCGCRFFPSCSEYTYQAIEKKGALKGIILGVKRIARCHPWSEGGVDEIK